MIVGAAGRLRGCSDYEGPGATAAARLRVPGAAATAAARLGLQLASVVAASSRRRRVVIRPRLYSHRYPHPSSPLRHRVVASSLPASILTGNL